MTVHFEGKLTNEESLAALLRRIAEIARGRTWLTEKFENREVTLLRVRANEEDWDYKGPSKGIILYLHEDCDPIRFEFDEDLYVQEWVKTQFAGVPIHLDLIKLLRDLQPFFEYLKIEDEGGYWETGNETALGEHLRTCEEAIADLARRNPSAKVKVRGPDGRWIDMIE